MKHTTKHPSTVGADECRVMIAAAFVFYCIVAQFCRLGVYLHKLYVPVPVICSSSTHFVIPVAGRNRIRVEMDFDIPSSFSTVET